MKKPYWKNLTVPTPGDSRVSIHIRLPRALAKDIDAWTTQAKQKNPKASLTGVVEGILQQYSDWTRR